MTTLATISNPVVKDIVRTLFLDGARRYEHLPRAGRGESVDIGLAIVVDDWATLSDSGMTLALEMGLAAVKLKREPHERSE